MSTPDPVQPPRDYSGIRRFFAGLMIEENIARKQDNVCLREMQKSSSSRSRSC
jgi:hypothetical protein